MRIKELCYLFTDGDWIETKDQSDEGIRLIQTGNIGEGVFLEKINKERYITEGTFKRLNCTEVFPEDILISRLPEPVGRGCIIPNKTERMITAVDCTICRLKNNLIDNQYFCYYINSPAYYKQLNQNVTGTTRKRISRKNLGNVEIKLPDKTRQLEIVSHLNIISSILNNKRKELQLLNDLTKARFVEMFAVIRETVPLSYYISSLIAGKSLAGEEECQNKVLKTGAVTYDYFIPSQVKNLPKDYLPLSEHQIKDGDVIISRMNTAELVGAAAYVWKAPQNTYLPDRLWRADLKNDVNPVFIWQVIVQPEFKNAIKNIAGGTSGSMKNISKSGLLGLSVIKVPYHKQNEFASFVQQVDKSKFSKIA